MPWLQDEERDEDTLPHDSICAPLHDEGRQDIQQPFHEDSRTFRPCSQSLHLDVDATLLSSEFKSSGHGYGQHRDASAASISSRHRDEYCLGINPASTPSHDNRAKARDVGSASILSRHNYEQSGDIGSVHTLGCHVGGEGLDVSSISAFSLHGGEQGRYVGYAATLSRHDIEQGGGVGSASTSVCRGSEQDGDVRSESTSTG